MKTLLIILAFLGITFAIIITIKRYISYKKLKQKSKKRAEKFNKMLGEKQDLNKYNFQY